MPKANSSLRSIRWDRSRIPGKGNFPYLIELAISRVKGAIEGKRFPLWKKLANLPVHRADGEIRRRTFRKDGAVNMQTLLTALLANYNIDSGLVIVPGGDAGPWDRLTWSDVDFRAFGKPVKDERSLRRTERHTRALVDLGLVEVVELKQLTEDGVRSLSAVKRVTEAFWDLIGLSANLSAERKRRSEERVQKREAALAAGKVGKKKDGSAKPPGKQRGTVPPAGKPPPRPRKRMDPDEAQRTIRKIASRYTAEG